MKKVSRLSIILAVLAVAAFLLRSSGGGKDESLWQHRNLGKAFYENPTMKTEAAVELKKALDLAPDSPRDRLNYGLGLLRAERTSEGIAELEAVQKQAPSLPHTWFNLGMAYKKEHRYVEAIAQFEKMAQLVPDEPVTRYQLGVLHNLQGDEQAALKYFGESLRLNPSLVAPRYQIYNVHRLAGREEEALREMTAFQKAKELQKALDESEDMDWSYYSELYDPIDTRSLAEVKSPAGPVFEHRRLPGAFDPASAGLAALDADGDDKPDLLAWSSKGVSLFRAGTEPVADIGLSRVANLVGVVPGDADNDSFPDLCVITRTGATLYRNVKASFEKQRDLAAGSFESGVWLDYDHDYDLDLFLFGAKSALLRNEGAAGFADRTSDFPFVAGHATGGISLRLIADSKAFDLAIAYRERSAVLYLDRNRGRYEPVPLEAFPAGSVSLRSFDIDNDGWTDLAAATSGGIQTLLNRQGKLEPAQLKVPVSGGFLFADLENRGAGDIVASSGVYRNIGQAGFDPPIKHSRYPNANVWAEADFNRDGRTDLAAVSTDGVAGLLLNRTATKHQWFEVTLAGVKNLKLAAGSEVELKAGACYQKKIYQGVPLLFGLRSCNAIDTVRVTWPNGMIQNETKQVAGQSVRYKEAPKLSGSCPMIYTWNGQRFEFLTDVLGVAPLGASSGDGEFFPLDHDEYIQISASALVPRDGRYDLRITEELAEVSYLDQIRLIAVDHPAGIEIFSNDKWKSPPFPEFRLFGVERRIYPAAARDHRGRDLTAAVRWKDRRYAGPARRNYQGVAETHALEFDFGAAARSNRAVLVLNGWVDWADGSTFLAASQEGNGGLQPPYLQVKDAAGQWRTVIEDMGMPSGKTKTIAVDLTGKFLSASREVRIVTNLCIYWDEIFLGEDSAEPAVKMTALDASAAGLRFRGYSRRVIHPQRKQPEYFDYARVLPVSNWNPTPGSYTRYGEVRELLTEPDDRMVIMGSGDELSLSFDAGALPPLPGGWTREYLLQVDGWAKDRDANTAFSQTVEPLPFHSMSSYPYPASERYPEGPEHARYRREYLTRAAMRLLGPLASHGQARSPSAGRDSGLYAAK